MKTIMINGYSGCGKDTLVGKIGEKAPTVQWSIADWQRYYVLDGIEETDASAKASDFVDDYRRTLIHLTNIGKYKRIVWNDLEKMHAKAEADGMDFFFVHCRDVRDFVEIKKRVKNTIALWVSRTGIEPSNEQDAAAAEYDYDLFIDLIPIEQSELYAEQIQELYEVLVKTEGK